VGSAVLLRDHSNPGKERAYSLHVGEREKKFLLGGQVKKTQTLLKKKGIRNSKVRTY